MKRTVAVCLATLFPSLAWSADLMEVYRDAVAHDARFAAAQAQFQAGQERVVQARAGLLPSIGASAGANRNSVDPSAASRTTYNSNSWGVQLTQPLYRVQNRIAARQGELQTEAAEVEFELARQDLILRVSEAYFNVLNAQDALSAVVQLRTAAAEQLEIARTSFEVGTVTITDVHEAQSRFDLAVAQVIAAESGLDVARQALAQVIGRDPEVLATLRPDVEFSPPQPANPLDWAAAAEQGGYAVQLQLLAREIAEQDVLSSRAGHYPTVDLVASHGHASRQSMSSGRADSTTIGVQLNVPLYAGGAISSREREAAALRVKADSDVDDARRSAALAARQAFVGVTSGMAQIKALEAAEVSSNSALEANRLGYEVGVRINIDVLNAQTQLADTRRQLAQARYDTLLAQLRLKAAAGALGEDDIEAINALLGTTP
ncbi:MAG: TolC family outer membrane protein [Rhodocyclaceae bacterium]